MGARRRMSESLHPARNAPRLLDSAYLWEAPYLTYLSIYPHQLRKARNKSWSQGNRPGPALSLFLSLSILFPAHSPKLRCTQRQGVVKQFGTTACLPACLPKHQIQRPLLMLNSNPIFYLTVHYIALCKCKIVVGVIHVVPLKNTL